MRAMRSTAMIGGRVVERPAARSSCRSDCAGSGLNSAAAGDPAPEAPPAHSRAPWRRPCIAVGQHRGVHGTGRGAGDAVDPQPWLFEQPVEHAPGEGAVRAAALQREVDQPWRPLVAGRGWFDGHRSWHSFIEGGRSSRRQDSRSRSRPRRGCRGVAGQVRSLIRHRLVFVISQAVRDSGQTGLR